VRVYHPVMTATSICRRAALLASFSGLIAFTALPARAADLIHPGQYEFTNTTDGHAHTFSYCISPDKARLANGDSKSGREEAEKEGKGRCSIQSYDVTGSTVSYRMTCNGTVLTSTTTYHDDTSEGDVASTRTVDGK